MEDVMIGVLCGIEIIMIFHFVNIEMKLEDMKKEIRRNKNGR